MPMGIRIEANPGQTILDAAAAAGVSFANACSGEGVCGGCKVRIISGQEYLDPPSRREENLISKYRFSADERAACMVKPKGDIMVTTSYW